MKRIEKTVFICYRRANAPWALAIYKSLKQRGYDVFFDFKSIGSGDFEQIILENVRARAHFLVLLTPSALERCDEPEDWLRREIEFALDSKRNIVPIMLEGFDFDASVVRDRLKGKMATLKRYNALRVTADYFEEAMARLQEQYLNTPIETVLHPPLFVVKAAAKEQQAAANDAPAVQKNELIAQQWFEKGYALYLLGYLATGRFDEAIEYFNRAIDMNPFFAAAFKYRGFMRWKNKPMLSTQQDRNTRLEGVIGDFTEAIRLRPDDVVEVYYWRAEVYEELGNLKAAAGDYSKILHIDPIDTKAYYHRAKAREKMGDVDGAIDDFTEGTRVYVDYLIRMTKLQPLLLPPEEVRRTYDESNKIIRDLKRQHKNRK